MFVTLAGSHAHGTAGPQSDVDLRGVCIAPLAVRLSLFEEFEQFEGPLDDALRGLIAAALAAHPTAAASTAPKTECVIFDVAKFLSLCAAGNPNTLEVLFADPADWLHDTASWRRVHGRRHAFLTTKVQQTFLGYALAQLKKIRSHRSWLLQPPERAPTRADFGLPGGGVLARDEQHRIEQSIAEKLRSYGIDDIEMPNATRIAIEQRTRAFLTDLFGASEDELERRIRAVATLGLQLPADVVAGLNAESRYRAALKRWNSFLTWQQQRNPARAALEARHGYDTKHAMHLIRLMRMGLEILETGDLRVRRPDAEELRAIRDGALSYEQLLETASILEQKMGSAAERCQLPTDIDRDETDRIARECLVA